MSSSAAPSPEPGGSWHGLIASVSGASAGLVSGVVVCPLDAVKTRLQVQGFYDRTNDSAAVPSAGQTKVRRPSAGILGTARAIVTEDGVRGLYSGLNPLLVGYLPSWAIYFYVYKSIQRLHGPDAGPRAAVSSAVMAGACSTVATNPIWMIKTRLMVQSKRTSWHYNGMIDAARTIYRTEGLRAFYSGLGSALLGLPHVAIHFPLYEMLKRKFAHSRDPAPTSAVLAASMISKVVASTLTYPHEVVRSRNQIKVGGDKYRGVWRTVRTLWVEEGWRVFYAGLTANVCRAVPASAVTLVTFEFVSANLNRRFGGVAGAFADDVGSETDSDASSRHILPTGAIRDEYLQASDADERY